MNQYPEREPELDSPVGKGRLPGYSGLFLSAAFRNLGMSLVSLFIPLYLLRLTGQLTIVFVFYAVYHLIVVLAAYPMAVLIRRTGVDLVGFLGAIARTAFIFCLIQAESTPSFVWLGAVIWGIAVPLTWLPFHYSFTIAEQEDGKYGKEVAQLQVVYRLTGLLGPAAGGILATIFGFKVLFSVTMLLTLVSGLPLFFDKVTDRGMRLSGEKIVSHLKKRKRRRFWFSLVGGQLEADVVGLVWPIFIYQAVGGYETIGFIKSAAAIVSVVLVWFLGRWIDRRGKSVLRLGTLVNSSNLLVRPFLTGSVALFLVDASYSMTSGLVATPFESAFYEEAAQMRKLEFMVERELILHGSGALICLLIGLGIWLGVSWFWLFSLGAIGLWLENLILTTSS